MTDCVIFSHEFGVRVIDRNKNVLWEWDNEGIRFYGLSLDPLTGNIYVGDAEDVYEITRTGSIAWRYRHPRIRDLHSVILTPQGNVLLACAETDRVIEVNKKKGIIWEWWVGNHYKRPKIEEGDWTHLNYARRLLNGDTLISLYRSPDNDHGILLRVNREGEIIWKWEEQVKAPHCIIPYKTGYLIADTNNKRLLWITKEGHVKKELDINQGVHNIEVLSNGNLLLAISKGLILEVTPEGKEVWRYEVEKQSMHIHVALPVPAWNVVYTKAEKQAIIKRLKCLGYLG